VSERVTDAIKRISPDSLARLAPASVKRFFADVILAKHR